MRWHPHPNSVMSESACLSVTGTIITKSSMPIFFTWKCRAVIAASICAAGRPRLPMSSGCASSSVSCRNAYFVRVHRSFVVSLSDVTKFAGNTVYFADKEFPIGHELPSAIFSTLHLVARKTGSIGRNTWSFCSIICLVV